MKQAFGCIFVFLGLVVTSFPAHATSLQDRYSSFFVFGDSLSDPGNTPFGSITDGEVWAEPLTNGFAPGSAANFATIGAEVIKDGDVAPFDLSDQILAFKAGVSIGTLELGSQPLAAFWIGANDVFSILENFDSMNPLFNPQRAVDAALNVVATIEDLYTSPSIGIRDFVVFDLPDLGATPFAKASGPAAEALLTAMSELFNDTLYSGLDGLTVLNPAINQYRIPIFDLIAAAIQDPPAYGVVSMEIPCNVQPLTSGIVNCEFATGFTAPMLGFYDAVHPSSTLHGQIGDIVVETATVPLPASAWMLLLALAGLAGRKRLSRRA